MRKRLLAVNCFRNNSEKLGSTHATNLGSIPAKKRQFFENYIFKVPIDFKELPVHTTDNVLVPEFTERSYILKQTCSFQLQVCFTIYDLSVDTRH